MHAVYDAAGKTCWLTVTESIATRTLELDGCEEGAMFLDSEEPVFRYLWFHHCSALAGGPPRRLLVLGAGAFTAPKCLAIRHPDAVIDVVDIEPELELVARHFFRLDEPRFRRIAFHGQPAEDFLAQAKPPYDFIFDDLFDGFQHVPDDSRTREHFRHACELLSPGGIYVKNIIWSANSAHTRAACAEAQAALEAMFPHHLVVALGKPSTGHNRLLLGSRTISLEWRDIRPKLLAAGMPPGLLESIVFDLE